MLVPMHIYMVPAIDFYVGVEHRVPAVGRAARDR
jgi:hypothetical protein